MKVRWMVLGSLALTVFLSGCQLGGPVKMQPTKLQYTLQENLVTFEQPRHKLIRVAQFVDGRDRREVKGEAPLSWELLVAAWRIGDFYTGDKVWQTEGQESVASAVSKTLEDSLKKTNFFQQVQMDQSSDPSGGSGLILKGRIDSLHGHQRLKKYRYFALFTWGSKQEVSTPVGSCKLTYTLVDAETNQVLKTSTVEANVKNAKQTISGVGAEALSQADTLVANEVTTRALLEF